MAAAAPSSSWGKALEPVLHKNKGPVIHNSFCRYHLNVNCINCCFSIKLRLNLFPLKHNCVNYSIVLLQLKFLFCVVFLFASPFLQEAYVQRLSFELQFLDAERFQPLSFSFCLL
ncbi:hypothetical protein MA16_Dca000825 [Dendrobium catenatum]|uniref:Uncharacterized protein n=1 Tax=Dendrobium catenatum TaxID=906689 RepID=A0A2I0WUY7_9ASPA|nr:hypothetical protein MA16_Dca000825 [Dendrobium catenatum]